MKNLAIEYELRCDLAASRLVEAREAVRAARARLAQATLCAEIDPSNASTRGLEQAEHDLWIAERRALALQKTTRGIAAH